MNLPKNLPNQITIARIVLAAVLFLVLHAVGWAQQPVLVQNETLIAWVRGHERLLLNLGAVIFLLAAISDILDGQIARRWNLTTDFGRIADPFADKVIVSGAFLFLVPIAGSGVQAWMVVVIVARESLVDGLRGFAESRGIAFPASWWGKLKMVSQSCCLVAVMLFLANLREGKDPLAGPSVIAAAQVFVNVLLGVTIFSTLYSGLLYVLKARTILSRGASGERLPAHREPEPVATAAAVADRQGS